MTFSLRGLLHHIVVPDGLFGELPDMRDRQDCSPASSFQYEICTFLDGAF